MSALPEAKGAGGVRERVDTQIPTSVGFCPFAIPSPSYPANRTACLFPAPMRPGPRSAGSTIPAFPNPSLRVFFRCAVEDRRIMIQYLFQVFISAA